MGGHNELLVERIPSVEKPSWSAEIKRLYD